MTMAGLSSLALRTKSSVLLCFANKVCTQAKTHLMRFSTRGGRGLRFVPWGVKWCMAMISQSLPNEPIYGSQTLNLSCVSLRDGLRFKSATFGIAHL